MAGLDGFSDEELRAEQRRRKPKTIRVREYDLTEDQYHRLHGRHDDDDDDEGGDDDDEEEGNGAPKRKSRSSSAKRGGYFG